MARERTAMTKCERDEKNEKMERSVRLGQQGLRAPALKAAASCMRNMLDVVESSGQWQDEKVRVYTPSRQPWTGKSTSAMPFRSLQTLRSVTLPSPSRGTLSNLSLGTNFLSGTACPVSRSKRSHRS